MPTDTRVLLVGTGTLLPLVAPLERMLQLVMCVMLPATLARPLVARVDATVLQERPPAMKALLNVSQPVIIV